MNNEQEQYAAKHIEQLLDLKNNFREEIPEEIIESHMVKDGMEYKVQIGWWLALQAVFCNIQRNGLLLPDLSRKIDDFTIKYFKNPERVMGPGKKVITKEDIEDANDLIDEVLTSLEGN